MTIRKKTKQSKIIIDLTGPDGNAYVLLGYAHRFAKQIGLDTEALQKEMTSGDYEHLLEVFDSHFGSFCILER